ncbi:MAG: DoxX family protein [Deltaproteobacteria bacterium]|nr:DoxX family protein [Deltaproteobacteria bacterium]
MTRITTVLRLLLGTGFVVFGLNYFLHFLPEPEGMPPAAMAFVGALVSSKLLTFVKIIEIGAGALLLANRFVPLALALLAPILVGIAFFHAVLVPSGLPVAVVFLGLELALAWSYRAAFAPMLRARVAPTAAVPARPRVEAAAQAA